MLFPFVAALALSADPTADVAGTPVQSNLQYSTPTAGTWTYAPLTDGSEATFADPGGRSQLTIRCTRSMRRIDLIKNAAGRSPSMWIWTSSQKKLLPATYDSAAGRITAGLGAYDSLLDAMASSRGRIGFSTSGLEALVVPPWGEVGRVIEDCRV